MRFAIEEAQFTRHVAFSENGQTRQCIGRCLLDDLELAFDDDVQRIVRRALFDQIVPVGEHAFVH